jgi:hypothetical protein
MTERMTLTVKARALDALKKASMEVLYEDDKGQAWIPEDKMDERASELSKLSITMLKWAEQDARK